jgi:hypothetical protein
LNKRFGTEVSLPSSGALTGKSDRREEAWLSIPSHFGGSRASLLPKKEQAVSVIRNLQGHIPGLLNTWVGPNISPRSQGYELGGVMQFSDRAALDAYSTHPAHQKALAFLLPLIEPIEVDFEV